MLLIFAALKPELARNLRCLTVIEVLKIIAESVDYGVDPPALTP
jgi:hypothetical protein